MWTAELPVLDFAGTPGSYGEFIVTPLITEDGSFATIVNAQGEVVWAWPTGGTTWRFRSAWAGVAGCWSSSTTTAALATAPGACRGRACKAMF